MPNLATKTAAPLIEAERDVSFADPRNGDERLGHSLERVRLLWFKRQAIWRYCLVSMIFSGLIAYVIPSRYTSTARLMPPDQSNSSATMLAAVAGSLGGGRGSPLAAAAGDLLGLKSSGDLFVGVLQSRTVEEDLVFKFDLQKEYGDRLIEDARKDLEKKTNISADRKSGIIAIAVTDRSAQKAAQIVQEYIDELNRVVTKLNTSSASREREFLEGRLSQARIDLESAEKSFSAFASKNNAIDIPAQGKAMIEAAATLEGQLVATQTELESLRQIYTENNVRVRASQARVDELKRQLQKLGGSSDASEASASSTPGQSIPSIRQLPLLGVPYADLYRSTKVQEAIYEALTEEYEFAKVQEAKETPSVKVLDLPDIPQKKSFPPRLLMVLFGTLLGGSAVVCWIFVKASWDSTEPADPRKMFVSEVLGSISRGTVNGDSNGVTNEPGSLWTRLKVRRKRSL